MHMKVLCFLFIVAVASGAILPPLNPARIIKAGENILKGKLIGQSSDQSSSSSEGNTKSLPDVADNILNFGKSEIPQFFDGIRHFADNLLHIPKPVSTTSSEFSDESSTTESSSNDSSTTESSPTDSSTTESSSNDSSTTESSSNDSSTTESSSTDSSTTESSTTESSTTETSTSESSSTESTSSTTELALPLSTIDDSVRVRRKARSIEDIATNLLGTRSFVQLLNFDPLGNVSKVLSKVNFSNVSKQIPLISAPQDVNKLPVLPGLKENILYARNLTVLALGGGKDFRITIHNATERAVHSISPISALTALTSTILHIYYQVAVNSPLFIVGTAVLEDGLYTIESIIVSVLSIVTDDVSRIINTLSG